MRELKAGSLLVFDTLSGWLCFFLILLGWIFVMFLSSIADLRDLPKNGLRFWFFYMLFWPISVGTSQLAQGYKSVLSCGGLYCVPRLRTGMKRFSVITGFVLAFIFTLPWFLVKGLTLQETYICMALSFTLLAAWFIGTSIPLPATSKNTVFSVVWLLWVAIFFRLFLAIYPGISFMEGWPITLAAGIFLCVIYCGPYKDKQIQNAHRQLAASTTDTNEDVKQAKLKISPNIEKFFINRLTRCSQRHKYLWGAIYPCLGTLLSCVRQTLLIVLVLAIMCGFLPTSSPMIIVFIMIMVISGIGINVKLTVHSQMLIAGGRRQRYYGTLAAAIGFSIAIGLMFVLIAGLSQLIAPIIPPFIFRGHTITFTPLSVYPAIVAMGIIPALFALALCHKRAPFITDFVVILLAVPALAFLSSIDFLPSISTIFGLVLAMFIVISGWAFLILTARIICYQKDLILQTDKI